MPINKFISNSKKADSGRVLAFLWHEAMEGIGFDRLLFTLLTEHKAIGRKAGHVAWFKYPQAWLAQYSANHYEQIDPVYRYMFTTKGAFTWDSLRQLKKLTQPETDLLNMARHAGLNGSICIPLRGAAGEFAVVTAASSAVNPQLAPDALDYADLLTEQFYKIYLRLERRASVSDIMLTDKERQILAYFASGQRQGDIATVLQITPSAVRYHMRGIFSKLETRSLETALLKAMLMGLIPQGHVSLEQKK